MKSLKDTFLGLVTYVGWGILIVLTVLLLVYLGPITSYVGPALASSLLAIVVLIIVLIATILAFFYLNPILLIITIAALLALLFKFKKGDENENN
jgi:flagellar motor component MotA